MFVSEIKSKANVQIIGNKLNKTSRLKKNTKRL